MAIIFKEKLKTQQFFLIFLIFVVIVSIFIIGKDFFVKKDVPEVEIVPKPIAKIEIDFELLKSPLLENLEPIEKIIPLETGIGRENPFSPIKP